MAQKKDWNDMTKSEKILGLVMLGLLVLVAIAVFRAIFNQPEQAENPSKPSRYEYRMIDYKTVDPATIQFSMELSNPTDTVWSEPSCTITFENPTGQYKGWDIFAIEQPINGHSSRTFTGNVTVTNEGAGYVSKYTVECE